MTLDLLWSNARRILCVRLDNIGDVLMSTPAIRALRHASPDAHISLLASRAGASLAPFLPDVDDVIAHDAPWVKNANAAPAATRDLVDTLQQRQYDAAVIFTVYTQSALPAALVCHLAGIPAVLAHVSENPYHLVSHWVRETEPEQGIRHEVQRQLDLVATVGACCPDTRLGFRTRDHDWRQLLTVLDAYGIDKNPGWIVVHCGASAPSRRYSPAKFARVISMLHDTGLSVVLTGGPDERPLVDSVLTQCTESSHVINLAGELSLGELACLIEAAHLLISNNTGPAHIAAALQTPVVDLYALTNPQHAPWQVAHRLLYRDVPCRNCYSSICPQGTNACLNGVTPQAVMAAALELLVQDLPDLYKMMVA